MLQELADESDNQVVKMNKSKMETDTPIYVNNTQIDNFQKHAYFQQLHTAQKHGHSPPKQRTS